MFHSLKRLALVGATALTITGGIALGGATSAEAQSSYVDSGHGPQISYASYHRSRDRRYRRRDNSGAVIAGVVGGLAAGALAGSFARPQYYPGYSAYPAYGGGYSAYPAYGGGYAAYPTYGGGYYPATRCWIERRRLRTNSGKPLYQDRQVCR